MHSACQILGQKCLKILKLAVPLFIFCFAAHGAIKIGIPTRAALDNDSAPFINILNKAYGALLKDRIGLDIEFVGLKDVEELFTKMNTHNIDAAAFWTELEYLYIKRRLNVTPLVTTAYNLQGGADIQKVIVVRKNNNITTISALRGKIMSYHRRVDSKELFVGLDRSDMHMAALKLFFKEAAIDADNFVSPQSFFISENLNPQAKSSVILSVLQNQADFALVNDLDFKLTAQNVPRVALELTTVPIQNPIKVKFPPLFCRFDVDHDTQEKVISVMTHAHEHILGQAALAIIPTDYFVRVTDKDYEETALYEQRLIDNKILSP